MLKIHQLGVSMQVTKGGGGGGALFIGKAGSHCVILLHCEVFLEVLLGVYCKRFSWIPSFHYTTVVLREFGKAKSATQNVLMKH